MRKKYMTVRILNLILVLAMLLFYQIITSQRADKEAAAISKAKKEAARSGGAAPSQSSPYKDGTYEGSAEGYGGTVVMKVSIKDGKIADVQNVSASGEDASYWSMAKELIPQIKEAQDPNVDAVSGATYTSNGIKNAVKLALQKAVK